MKNIKGTIHKKNTYSLSFRQLRPLHTRVVTNYQQKYAKYLLQNYSHIKVTLTTKSQAGQGRAPIGL